MKMFKLVMMATALTAAIACPAANMDVSSGEIITGQWNSHFNAGKAYAEANDLPMVLFWASPGCSMCEKLEKAVSNPDSVFPAWMATKPYVFVFVIGTSSAEDQAAKDFAFNKSRDFPYICVYWQSKGIKNNFTGRSTAMPSKEGSSLEEKFINSIELVLGGGAGGGTITPVTPGTGEIPEHWKKARTVGGILYSESMPFAGIVEAKFGKANKKTGKAKVTVSVTMLGGTKKRLTGTVSAYDKEITVSSAYGSITLGVSSLSYAGSIASKDGEFFVESAALGGLYPDCNVNFTLLDYPTEYLSNPVLTKWLPGVASSFVFKASGKKWTFPSKGLVKWNAAANDFVATKSDNPSGLKLTYANKTGLFKGSYSTYVQTAATKVKKVSTKVVGYVYNGIGYGLATAKGLKPVYLQIEIAP